MPDLRLSFCLANGVVKLKILSLVTVGWLNWIFWIGFRVLGQRRVRYFTSITSGKSRTDCPLADKVSMIQQDGGRGQQAFAAK